MKKLFTLSFFVASCFVSQAQTGSVLVGGNVGISTNSDDQTSLNLSPFVGYQFNNNWTAGLAFDLASQKEEEAGNTYKTTAFAVGPFVRYTHSISDIFSVFGQFEAKYATAKNKYNSNTVNEANGFGLNLYPAVFINVKNGFGLNFDFGGISYASVKPEGGSSQNAFELNFGKTINIGISKNFGGKKK